MACLPFLAAFGAAVSGCAPTVTPEPQAAPNALYRPLDSADAIVDPLAARDIISVYRHNKGLPTVAVDSALQDVAKARVAAMAKANAVSQSAGGTLKARLAAAKIHGTAAVENVSAGYHSLAEAFAGWRQSPFHDANMLNPKVRRIGIATAYVPGSKYKVFWSLVLTD
jgi:uncharacterized protein YkwD